MEVLIQYLFGLYWITRIVEVR
jgi:PPOX class probable F420-dependent enzyme